MPTVQGVTGGLAGFFAQIELELGPLAAEPRKHGWKQERGNRRNYAHPELAMQRLAFDPGDVGQLLAFAQHLDRLVGYLLAKGSEADDPASALDQGDAEQCLK